MCSFKIAFWKKLIIPDASEDIQLYLVLFKLLLKFPV